jgi:hypothetical protein
MILSETYKNRLKSLAGIISEEEFTVFHGTNSNFKDFSNDYIGSNTDGAWNGYGFYFSDSKIEAGLYGNKIVKAIIELNKPFRLDIVKDTSIGGSGIVRLFANTSGLKDVKFEGKTMSELNEIVLELESKNIPAEFMKGSIEPFQHVYFEYDGEDYTIYNRTEAELANKKHVKSMIISKILYEVYGISGLPIRISEILNPYSFTKILQENGYDGVIAPNSTVPNGNEYVVFNKDQIKIIE